MDRVAALYRNHIAFVWRMLGRAHMSTADVKDLAQQVFLVVLRKLRAQDHPPLKTEDEERSWLYVITSNELKNYRDRARFRRVESMDDHANDFADARNGHAWVEDRETLVVLLESIQVQGGREVFELVELEGFSVVQAAQTLNITETNAHRRLGLARRDVEAKVAKLRREAAGQKQSALLMAFGVVPWDQLRALQDPPPGAVEEIWKRLQATVAKLDRENDGSAAPSPPGLHARPQARPALKKLAGLLKSPWFNLVSACIGGAIVALLFLLRPNTKLVPYQVSVPIVIVTTSSPAPTPPPAPTSSPVTPPTDVTAAVDQAIDEEGDWIRRIRADLTKGNRKAALEALTAYERRFPTGRLRNVARSMRVSLDDAGAR